MHCAHRGGKATSAVSGCTVHTQENQNMIWICGNKISEVVAKLE